MSKKLTVAVVGATGAVGREMLKTLHDRQFPATEVRAFASARSAGTKVPFGDDELVVQELKEDVFEGIDIAIFSAGGSTSEKFAPHAAHAGCVVVDNSSQWRMDDRCPLVVPEVNPEHLEGHQGIIANPNCSTIQMLVALKPIHDAVGIKRIVVSTYQAVSGTGQKGLEELERQTRDLFNMREPENKVYPYRIACVRVPVFYCHSEAVNIETHKKMTAKECRILLSQAPGVRVFDNPREKMYPMPAYCVGDDETYVGRIREDETIENGLNLWIVADNVRKGAALNAVQIAEELLRRDLVRVPDRNVFMS